MKSFQALAIIISLLAHLSLYLGALAIPDLDPLPKRNLPIEIVYQNETKKNERPQQTVSDPNEQELQQALKDLKDRANYISRLARRVEKESVATRAASRSQNAIRQMARRDLRSSQPQHLAPKHAEKDPSGTRPPLTGTIAKEARLSDSTIADYIPEVREGGFTALNSDQFVHYTFYARINEQIRNRWVENIRNFLNQTPQGEINRIAQRNQLTQIEILLEPSGRFVKALIHQQSQNPLLDQCATFAFEDASPLHNPPSEMVEADGYVHLRYGFYLQFRPRYMASGSTSP